MRIYLIRHGQSTNNAHLPHVPDPPLTERGREQSARAATALRTEEVSIAALYVSPMRRALETALILNGVLQSPTFVLRDLCEIGGMMANRGMCRQEIEQIWPTATLDESITETGWWTPTEDEETEEAAYARAARTLAGLRARHRADAAIAIVTHGTFGSALLSTLLGLGPNGYYERFEFDNCGISRVDIEPTVLSAEFVRVISHNATGHLT